MIKILLVIRYLVRLLIFIGLFVPVVCILYPFFALLDAISSPRPSDWIADDMIKSFFNLAIWGK